MAIGARPFTDDRGRTIAVPMPEIGHTAGPSRRGLLGAARQSVHALPMSRTRRLKRAVIVGLIVAALVALFSTQVYFHAPKSDWRGTIVVALLVGFGIGYGVFNLTRLGPPLIDLRPLLSMARLCLSCGYDLEGLDAAHDGCTVCPECGAAFRLGGTREAASPASPDR